MHRATIAALLLLVLPALGADGPAPGAPPDGEAWLARVVEKLTTFETASWDVDLEMLEIPESLARRPHSGMVSGTTRYRFRIKGKSRVHWRQSRGETPLAEAWYEGFAFYYRSSQGDGTLSRAEVGEWEGWCVGRSNAEGGVLGWRISHGFGGKRGGSAFIKAIAARLVREEAVGDRRAVVLELDLGMGFGPERARNKLGISRLWIDRESLLPIKRETSFTFVKDEGRPSVRARESYSGWLFDEPMTNESFHVEGMPEADVLVDAPTDPAAFEETQTRKFLGFGVSDLPAPSPTEPLSEGFGNALRFRGKLTAREWSLPAKEPWSLENDPVIVTAPDGAKFVARCTRETVRIAAGHPFVSSRTNRRHLHGLGAFNPSDIYVGKEEDGKLVPSLFFRDVGSHDSDPFDFCVDSKGRCHLAVAVVDIGQDNAFKLLWLTGDFSTGKWTEVVLVDHRQEFTSWAHPRLTAHGDNVHLVWNWLRDSRCKGPDLSGVYYVARTPDGFGPRTRLSPGGTTAVDVAVDPDTGRVIVLTSVPNGILAISRLARIDDWTAPTLIHAETSGYPDSVSIEARGNGKFLVRSDRGHKREWILECE